MKIPDLRSYEDILSKVDLILLLVTADIEFNEKLCTTFTDRLDGRRAVIIKGKQAEDLLYLYSLYAFTDKLIIGSLDLPYGRKLRNLLDSKIATEDEIINDIILGGM